MEYGGIKMENSTTEKLALNALTNEYGELRDPMPKDIVEARILQAKTNFNYMTTEFYRNQSSFNYNLMVNSMIQLQYWNQKKVIE
tara:strand:+ start:369 stop:623 length:255 start_codon:yes stop_codon:yes gene_type:complete